MAVARSELKINMLLRLTPLNPATVSYILGATGVRFPGFLLACLALTPHLLIEVYFGFAGKHLARISRKQLISTFPATASAPLQEAPN